MKTDKNAELHHLLANVRDAYRLVWAYQRRCLDTAQLIADQFAGLGFYQWSSLLSDPPPQRGTPPFKRWTWDFIPLHSASFLFVRNGEGRHVPKAGEWMLEIRLKTDTAVEPTDKLEPDPTIVAPSGTSQTTIALIAWKCTDDFGKNDTWLHSVWNESPYQESGDLEQGKFAVRCGGRVRVHEVESPLEKLATRGDVVAFVDRAKSEFEAVLAITSNELELESAG